MNENSQGRLPTGLIWLLIYQWSLVLGSVGWLLYYSIEELLPAVGKGRWGDAVPWAFGLLVLACWGTAMFFASVEMHGRRSRGFLLGMICHLPLAIPGVLWVLFCGYMHVTDPPNTVLPGLFLGMGLMGLPFAVFNSWAFFYLLRLRTSLLP